jgi:hypothetical protein
MENIIYFFYKTTYFIEEVNCTEPFPSVSIPWTNALIYLVSLSVTKEKKFSWHGHRPRSFGAWPVGQLGVDPWCSWGLDPLASIGLVLLGSVGSSGSSGHAGGIQASTHTSWT